jgi:hemoglobin/transferrin/lactoferrin receptor protein
MSLKDIVVLLIFFGLTPRVFAQQVQILEKVSQTPLPGVLIYSKDSGISTLSDENGKADLDEFNSQQKIVFQLMGFETQTVSWETLEKNAFQVQLIPEVISLDIAIVAASRWKQNSQDIAGKIRHLDSEKLILRSPPNMSDWLGSSGEVFVQKSQQGGGSPMIRGFSANRLLYAVDEVRMNTAIFRSGNLQNVISLDPFTLRATEILFGPGSVMYGSDAIGGVMAFETLSPEFSNESPRFSGTGISRFSSANKEKTFHADMSYGNRHWAFLSSISHFDYGDLKIGGNGPQAYLRPNYVVTENGNDLSVINPSPELQVGSGYSQLNLMQKIKFKASDLTELEYGFHYSNTGNIPRYDRLIEKQDGNLRFAVWNYGPQLWMMNNLGIRNSRQTQFYDQFKLKIAHQLFEESRIDRRFGNANQFTRTEQVNAFSVNADFLKNFRKESFFSYGAEWVSNFVKSKGENFNLRTGNQTQASSRYPQAEWISLAAFGTFHSHISEKVKLQTGGRFNYTQIDADFSQNQAFYPLPFSNTSNSYASITGSLGMIYTPEKSFSIAPLLSTGFRAPNVDDIGKIFDSEPGNVLVPNPDLKPEYAYNAELNLNKHFNQKFKIDLSVFYTFLDRAMVRRPFELNGEHEIWYDGELSQVLAIQNAAFAKIYGIQAGIEWLISKNLTLTSRYNWQKGTEELDDESKSPSRHAAPAFGLSRLRYSKNKVQVEITAQYSAKRTYSEMPEEEKNKPQLYALNEDGLPYSPSWIVFGVNTTYQVLPALQVMMGIENLADIRYRPYSSGISAPGRNLIISLKGTF